MRLRRKPADPALTPEQQRILEQRGVLSPEEIHKLANKTKKAMTGGLATSVESESATKASCHSDYVDPETAKKKQEEKLVPLGIGIKTNDRVI